MVPWDVSTGQAVLLLFSGLSTAAGWMAAFLIRGIAKKVDDSVEKLAQVDGRVIALETWRIIAEKEIAGLRERTHDISNTLKKHA